MGRELILTFLEFCDILLNVMKRYITSYLEKGLLGIVLISGVFPAFLASPTLLSPDTAEDFMRLTSVQAFPVLGNHPTITAIVTGYSSTPDQTDDSPFVTAANTWVRDGIVATNFLPLYTRIQIPEIFGDKVFVVEDRMNKRFNDRIDVWFESRELAKSFGKRTLKIVILPGSGYNPANNINALAMK